MSASPDSAALTVPPPLPVVETAVPRPPRTWYFWGSTVFALLAFLANTVAGAAIFFALLIHYDVQVTSLDEVRALAHQRGWIELIMVLATPFSLAVLWGATRIARQGFSDYLGLHWPERREFFRGLAMVLALLLAWFLFGWAIGQKSSAFVVDAYSNAQTNGWLPVLVIAFCVTAPVGEEFIIRGFLLRGWSQSFLRPLGAIVLSSAVWTALHTQYNWFYLSEIFAIGLLLGYLRYRSGSTWLTVSLHAAINLIALVEVAVIVAYR